MFEYPKHLHHRSGIKVCWRVYDKREDAEAAAKVAQEEAAYQERRGYDFGFNSPGRIKAVTNGHFEVCCP